MTGSASPRLVIVSNRGPVQFSRAEDQRQMSRGAGGLVSALSSLPALGVSGVWVCAALTDEDRGVVAENHGEAFDVPTYAGGQMQVRMVTPDQERFENAHHGFSNSLLWFLQHQLWGWGTDPDIGPTSYASFDDYVEINREFAVAAVAEAQQVDGPVVVMIHDYHLYLVGGMVRELVPDVVMQHFVHIPWPGPDAWRALPTAMVRAILQGLAGCDVVAFHTEHYARNFMQTCERYLQAPVDYERGTVAFEGRQVRVGWYPISVDHASLAELAASEETAAEREKILSNRPEKLIVRVDRADPSKNIIRGFRAFSLMLERHPELFERVGFLALVQPSRSNLTIYSDYLETIEWTAEKINQRFGTPTWTPVELIIAESLPRALAAYQEFDVLLVNPVADGLNLVAKEGMLVNEVGGVLVLAEPAGVFEEIGAFAIGVNPFDLLGQAEALYSALMMPLEARRSLSDACREIVKRNDLDRWLGEQLRDLMPQRRAELSLLEMEA